jgi:hypothetical protein
VGAEAALDVGRLAAFLAAPADKAGDLLTFAEAARLARFEELRLEDREQSGELKAWQALGEPYLEAAGIDYDQALRQAHKVRDAFRAAHGLAAG